jgi:hypothetical protein
MTPDLGYYFRRFDIASFAHTILGSFAVCLPAGICLLLVFYLVRKSVCFILPTPHREALAHLCATPPKMGTERLMMAMLCLLIGAWSHILWDSFTHESGWFVQRIAWLQAVVFTVGSASFRASYLLQQFSSAAGAVILIIAYLVWLHRHRSTQVGEPGSDVWRYLLWAGIISIALLFALPLAARIAQTFQGFLAFRVFVFRAGVYFLSIASPLIVLSATTIYALRNGAWKADR